MDEKVAEEVTNVIQDTNATQVASDAAETASSMLDKVKSLDFVGYAFNVVCVIVVLIIGYFLAKILSRVITKACKKAKLDETLATFLGRAVFWLILVMVMIACLGIFGIETTSLAAVVGAAGLAIGLAFQGTLSNLAAGVMIIVFRPFKLHDFISVGGQSGSVEVIDLFTTTLVTLDNRIIIVPNSAVASATIENVTGKEIRRVDVNVGVSYHADIAEAREAILRGCKVEGALEDPAPSAYLLELGSSSVQFSARAWCKTGDYWAVRERVTEQVKRELDAAGIEIPYQQVVVHQKHDAA